MRTPVGLTVAEDIFAKIFERGVNKKSAGKIETLSSMAAMVVGIALARAAIQRAESRGAHLYFNSDDDIKPVSRRDPEGRMWNVVNWDRIYLIVTKKTIPERTENKS